MKFLNFLLALIYEPLIFRWYPLLFLSLTLVLVLYFRRPRFQTPVIGKNITKIHLAAIISALLTLVSLAHIFSPQPTIISPSVPSFEPIPISNEHPLRIEFDRPLSPLIRSRITPEIDGVWQLESTKYGPLFPDTLTFTPHFSLSPDTEYAISLERIMPWSWLFLSKADQVLFVIKTPSLPDLIATQPSSEETIPNSLNTLTLDFDQNITDDIYLDIETKPPLSFNQTVSASKLTLELSEPLQSATTYQLKIYRGWQKFDYLNGQALEREPPQLISQLNLHTLPPAGISDIKPQGDQVNLNEELIITFDQDMNESTTLAALSLSPSIEGQFEFINPKEVVFQTTQSWALNTAYQLTLKSSAQSSNGSLFYEDLIHSFKTIGPIKLIDAHPSSATTLDDLEADIELAFDQPFRAISPSEVELIPTTDFQLEQTENKLILRPSGKWLPNTDYQLKINRIESRLGTGSLNDFSFNFKSSPLSNRLTVPQIHQQYNFTCYAAAARMALAYYDIYYESDMKFIEEIGFDDVPRNFSSNTWGNPNEKVVGTVDGSGSGGYGAHWQPVANVIRKHRDVEVKSGWEITELLKEVGSGNPALVWWVNGVWPARDTSWQMPSGEKVYTVNGMHVEVVTGWEGDISNPTFIYTNDPWRGSRKYTLAQFQNLWRWFNNTALIVK